MSPVASSNPCICRNAKQTVCEVEDLCDIIGKGCASSCQNCYVVMLPSLYQANCIKVLIFKTLDYIMSRVRDIIGVHRAVRHGVTNICLFDLLDRHKMFMLSFDNGCPVMFQLMWQDQLELSMEVRLRSQWMVLQISTLTEGQLALEYFLFFHLQW